MSKTTGTKQRGSKRKSPPKDEPQPPPSEAQPSDTPATEPPAPAPVPIVGIGASAGGLAAFEAFFSGMPAHTDPGMAFVLVQHLAPDHKSILTDLVKRYTRMQVFEVEDGMTVSPNCAYIIPPNRDMAFLNGRLQLLEPTAPRGMRLPIDFFFRSLAQDQHESAIGIVLSGTGSDGTLGVRAIKGEGGMVMAQSPESTEYDGMPHSAIATGLVDYVMPPGEMAAQLIGFAAHAFGKGRRPAPPPAAKTEGALNKIFILLRSQTGHDFSHYKRNTIVRRVERRMAVHQIEKLGEYARYLRTAPDEVTALFRDLLIGVTSFFRDPAAFAAFEKRLPRCFAGRSADAWIRVWVPGCSTGEEAYSIAILLQERMAELKRTFKVQVFATDIDSEAIEHARAGIYPASIAADVSPERLGRFFVEEPDGGAYRVQKGIRDLLVFSEQDVIKDPPFSKLDLISCRNMLIYMGPELQKKLIPLFHYSLKPDGLLFLGTSESVGEFADLFGTLDRKAKLYERKQDHASLQRYPLGRFLPPRTDEGATLPHLRAADLRALRRPHDQARTRLRELTEEALLAQCIPVGALVTAQGDILYLHGRTGQYLEPTPGEAGMNILKMARAGLRRELTVALHQAVARHEPVHHTGLRVKTNGDFTTVNLVVRPVVLGDERPEEPPADEKKDRAPSPRGTRGDLPDLYLVVLEKAPLAQGAASQPADTPVPDTDTHIAALKQELRAKEEYLQTTNEELETSNEELKSSNEEMQSINEELQSTNEELETSKEELQSVNEELATVNAELQNKVSDLSRTNNDMNNLLAGTGVGTIFVDHHLSIQRFTPPAAEIINLILSDVGRPLAHIVANLVGYDDLVADVRTVLDSLVPKEIEVQSRVGAWYLMRIHPYRTQENVIEGAVLTFVEITQIKRLTLELQDAKAYAESVIDTLREPLLVLDQELKVVSANRSFYDFFAVAANETVGHQLYQLGNGQWDIPRLRALLEEVLPKEERLTDYAVSHSFPVIGHRKLLLNARELRRGSGKTRLILLAIEDVTGRGEPRPKGIEVLYE